MASLNKVMIIGTLGRDPETSYLPNGNAVVKLNIATNEKWTDKSTGEKKERTEWHRVTFFGKAAETIGKYLSKGKQIYVEGRLQTTAYEKDGITRYTTDIIGSNFQFIGGRDQSNNQNQGFSQQQNSGGFQNYPNQNQGFQNNQPGGSAGFQSPSDSEIPF